MPLEITYQAETQIPVEIEGITPDTIREKSLREIRELSIYHGNRTVPFGHMFDVEGDPADMQWEMHGDLSGVHWIGAHMQKGSIHIDGPAGRHLGSEMVGGQISVDGDAGDWVGGELRGGMIRVRGNAGHLIGAAYRGSAVGMTGGTIMIEGSAGNEIGHTMRRGMIAIGGSAGDLLGFNMLAGSILVFGECGIRPGAGMRRGTLGLFGPEPPAMLPTFRRACRFQPAALRVMLRHLQAQQFPVEETLLSAGIELYNGDLLDGGRGEVLIRA